MLLIVLAILVGLAFGWTAALVVFVAGIVFVALAEL